MNDLTAVLARDEELLPELQPWVEETEMGIRLLKHPLVATIAPHNAMANEQYRAKKRMLDNAMLAKQWDRVIWLHERPYRLDAFMEIQENLSDEEYWSLLGDIWVDSENIWQNREEWAECLTSPRPGRHFLMSEEDRRALEALPDTLTIYRGGIEQNIDGLSWTLDEDQAAFFAKRLQPEVGGLPTLIATAQILKSDALAYFTGRSEDEILLRPGAEIKAVKRPLGQTKYLGSPLSKPGILARYKTQQSEAIVRTTGRTQRGWGRLYLWVQPVEGGEVFRVLEESLTALEGGQA